MGTPRNQGDTTGKMPIIGTIFLALFDGAMRLYSDMENIGMM